MKLLIEIDLDHEFFDNKGYYLYGVESHKIGDVLRTFANSAFGLSHNYDIGKSWNLTNFSRTVKVGTAEIVGKKKPIDKNKFYWK